MERCEEAGAGIARRASLATIVHASVPCQNSLVCLVCGFVSAHILCFRSVNALDVCLSHQVTKNRFDGDTGVIPLSYDRESLTLSGHFASKVPYSGNHAQDGGLVVPLFERFNSKCIYSESANNHTIVCGRVSCEWKNHFTTKQLT